MLDDLPPPSSSASPSASPSAGIAALADAATRLSQLATELGHRDVAEAIRDDAKRRLDDGRVRVVVLGEIKHGKTTLINALLGEALLPVGVTPTTGAVVAIRVDPEQTRTGTYLLAPSGERSELDAERFEALARGKDHDQARRVPELLVDPERLPATLELIDTPGFNDIDRFRAAVSRSELPRADVLVLVLDATQVLSRSELGLIRDAIAAVGGLGDSGARCVLVINRIDLVPEDERARIVEHIRTELKTVIPGELEPYLTDSKTALREPESEAEPARALARLRDELFGLAGRGREILPARARSALLRHARLLGYNAAIQARALRLEHGQIATEIDAVEQAMAERPADLASLRKMIAEAGGRIVEASEERLTKFRAELEEAARAQIHSADINTLTQVVPGAIQDAFLEFVHHESERLRAELEQLTRDVFATCGELARRRLTEATLPLSFRGPGIYVEPPAILIEVGMVALGLVGTVIWYFGNTMTGMVMTIASPLTTVILREKTVRDAREQARDALPEALDRAIEQLRETMGEVVARHGGGLDEHLMLADHALSEQLLDSLRRAEQRLADHERRVAKLLGQPAPTEAPTNAATSDEAGAPDEASEPETSEPESSEPSATEASESESSEPESSATKASEPESSEPSEHEPSEPESSATKASEPEPSESSATEASATKASESSEGSEPEPSEPESSESSATKASEPESSEPSATEPAKPEPSATEDKAAPRRASEDAGEAAPPESGPERLRQRVAAAAQAEFDLLERRLEAIADELESLNLDPEHPPETAPPILH
ncbi:Bacterial dynamin-like protein [Enhygromyxa salina]|uniref:Bacterial dynamin-like protein n=1 Tax=Enhygromyxa salina TaxID=215803 RepID=A0A2S9YEK0_9BACT|nr:dynamin family protein [Enhygromyxa salina]PRQ03545.1 Bacterial dynamin-like protein [Enhygromyxa salina]